MIEQSATVIKVEGDELVLETQPESTCQSCAVNKGCGTSVLAGMVGNKAIYFRLPNTLSASKGDRVVLGLPEHAVVKGSAIVYLLPLLAMVAVAILTDHMLAVDADKRDLAIAFISLVALVLTAALGGLLFKNKGTRQRYTPVLLRKEVSISTTP